MPEKATVERTDRLRLISAASVVAFGVSAITLTEAYLEKFGNDNMTDISAAVKSYQSRIESGLLMSRMTPRLGIGSRCPSSGRAWIIPWLCAPAAAAPRWERLFERLGLCESRGPMGRVRRRACSRIVAGWQHARPDVIKAVKRLFPARDHMYVTVPGAESSKSIFKAEKILGEMIKHGLTRNDLCLAIGGGVVGDLGASWRAFTIAGIDVVHVPTTLLAMVDSSIGGKTAVNHPEGKNLIGTFHQAGGRRGGSRLFWKACPTSIS